MPHCPEPDGAERLSAWLLAGPLTAMVVAAAVAQWACWVPHYLTWPWSPDLDVFATMARGWDAGFRPYRDLRGNNFPGTIYAHWIVGKLAGWGRTAPFLALDGALVLGLGLSLVGWSRRRFGKALPGAVGFLTFLGYYLALDYTQTAQRDWQGPLAATLAVLVLEARVGTAGHLGSALLFAAALATRPQTILFLPAAVSALVEPGAGGRVGSR